MLVVEKPKINTETCCYHCGEPCSEQKLLIEDKSFCCKGCKTVYEILSVNNLCDYYNFEDHPGISQKKPINKTKFSILDNKEVREKLISFSEKNQTHINFLLPTIHCSSCIWILENLQKINSNIINSRVDFLKKEIKIVFKCFVITINCFFIFARITKDISFIIVGRTNNRIYIIGMYI